MKYSIIVIDDRVKGKYIEIYYLYNNVFHYGDPEGIDYVSSANVLLQLIRSPFKTVYETDSLVDFISEIKKWMSVPISAEDSIESLERKVKLLCFS